jgi:hypothetical protein
VTSLADQDEYDLGGHLSVLVRQKRDHVELDRLLSELEASDIAHQSRVLRHLYRLVFPHAFAEEAVLWPVLRRVLPDGEALTLEVEREHQEVNELVTALESMPLDDPDRPSTVSRLVEVLRADVRDEEDVLLPRLQAAVSRAHLTGLGVAWEVVRRVSPTRAHPVVARRPPGNSLAALPLSVIDRLRDRLDHTIQQDPGRDRPRLVAASQLFTALAHKVEEFPPLKRGEHPATHR